MRGVLLLDNDDVLQGTLVGARQAVVGELVFNTSMTGYQEIVTDPSYHRQVVVLTQPEIGNYGCHPRVTESSLGHAAGLVVREISPDVWHRDRDSHLDHFLAHLGVTAIAGVDTRFLTRRIRDNGPANVAFGPADMDRDALRRLRDAAPAMKGANLVPDVSTDKVLTHGRGDTHILLLDFGIKTATIRHLVARGCRVTQVPWQTSLAAIAALEPDGILLSNGPGDPAAVPHVRPVVAALMDRYPVMGICLGFQLMALALGGETYKLPFGHHGGNHPVKFEDKVVITSQNHGFAVREESLDSQQVATTHRSLFDQSLEGFRLRDKPVFGVQFHPEAAPGPEDCLDHFDYFMSLIRGDHAQAR